jgi:hypothetical protein
VAQTRSHYRMWVSRAHTSGICLLPGGKFLNCKNVIFIRPVVFNLFFLFAYPQM